LAPRIEAFTPEKRTSFDDKHGAGRQSDEAIGRPTDDPLVKRRVTHEAHDQKIDRALVK
jgi:hypothetical protein